MNPKQEVKSYIQEQCTADRQMTPLEVIQNLMNKEVNLSRQLDKVRELNELFKEHSAVISEALTLMTQLNLIRIS